MIRLIAHSIRRLTISELVNKHFVMIFQAYTTHVTFLRPVFRLTQFTSDFCLFFIMNTSDSHCFVCYYVTISGNVFENFQIKTSYILFVLFLLLIFIIKASLVFHLFYTKHCVTLNVQFHIYIVVRTLQHANKILLNVLYE